MVIIKALYGLRLSGNMFNQLLAECLEGLGFKRSLSDESIFMRPSSCGTAYEYVATYVDDLCICAKEPEALLEQLQMKPYEFDLKGSGALNFHLGCSFDRDEDGTLCMDPSKYINKMEESYKRLFGEQPNDKVLSPLIKGDHPELDTSIFLEYRKKSNF